MIIWIACIYIRKFAQEERRVLSDTSHSLPLCAVGHLWTYRMGLCPGRESFLLNYGRNEY